MGKEDKDYSLDDLIAKSEELLEDIGDTDGLLSGVQSEAEEKVSSEIRQRTLESIKASMAIQINGHVEVTVSKDEMIAAADFHPPTGGMEPIKNDDVIELFKEKGITSGVDWDVVKETISKCNTERIQLSNIVVARGSRSVNEVPEHLVIEEKLIKAGARLDSGGKKVDYKEISPFKLVKQGEILARLEKKKAGIMGSTVLGKSLPYKTAKIPKITPGKNTRTGGDTVAADCDGRFEYDENSFWVNKVLEVESDIDYSTGHINFPGDVIIRGEIKDGFKVYSGGSLYCEKTMDASDIVCENDTIVNQGIIGKNRGTVKTGGSLRAKFIENCYVEAKGTIMVDTGILNSAIYTMKRLDLGGKGIIVGGKIYALDGVTATQVGSASGPKTEIYCGVDYSIEQKLEWIRDKNIKLAIKLQQVKNRLKKAAGDERLLTVHGKIQKAISQLNEAAISLVSQLDKNEEAEVHVKGSIYPGGYIEICHLPYIITRQMKHVRFRLDKTKGKIVCEPL